jgi:hypothetical protein
MLASLFCGPVDCFDELPLARFFLKDLIGGQPTTGAEAPLHQIRAPVSLSVNYKDEYTIKYL